MTQQDLFNLQIAPGIFTEETERGAKGRWHKGDKVRFRKGLPEKIGGWVRTAGPFLGTCRKLHDWTSLDGKKWTALATELKLYLYQDGTLYNITPIRREIDLTNPFDTTSGSPLVTVTDAANGAQLNDFVQFSGATVVGGLTLNGDYQIVEVLTGNTYRINAGSNASGTANGGGTVAATYEITTGSESTVTGRGWGTGVWSAGTWGTPRASSTTIISLRTWSADNWGEDLIASPNGGAIYWWDRSLGPSQRAVKLESEGTPLINSFIIVSQRDRQIISLGAYDFYNDRFDPLLIRWCSQEDFSDWLPTRTNTADDIRLYRGSKLVGALRTRGEIVLWTDVSMHSLVSVGPPDIFAPNVIGENVSLLGPNAAIAVDHRVFFMAEADFYVYDGVLRVLPCDVRNYVYGNLTVTQKEKVTCGLNREFSEVWWFYPAKNNDVWLETDFGFDSNPETYQVQSMTVAEYTVAFNAGGYVAVTSVVNATVYDSLYMMITSAVLQNPVEADYEVVFTLGAASPVRCGMIFNATDLSGVGAAGNAQGIVIEILPSTSTLYMSKLLADGTRANLTNAAASYPLSALATPITITVDDRYALLAKRTGNVVYAYLWDETSGTTQLVATVTLSAAEISLYTSGVAGALLVQSNPGTYGEDMMRVTSFRAAPAGTLTTSPSPGIGSEVNRYAAFNYEEGTWCLGEMVRTAWHDKSPVFQKAYAAGTDGYLYKHETGTDDNGVAMSTFIESYMMEVPESGDEMMHVGQLVPDFLTLEGTVNVKLTGRKHPQDPVLIQKGPFPVRAGVKRISPRIKARQIALRMESNQLGDRWRCGQWRGRAGSDGKR